MKKIIPKAITFFLFALMMIVAVRPAFAERIISAREARKLTFMALTTRPASKPIIRHRHNARQINRRVSLIRQAGYYGKSSKVSSHRHRG